MIKGSKKTALTPETILSKISAFDIFKFYMPERDWRLNTVTYSPFRNENHPSFVIGNKYGEISFIDFAETSLRGDCFYFVKCLFNLSTMNDVLIKIDNDFGLGISSKENVNKYKEIVKQYKQPEESIKRYSLIQVKTKKFTKQELEYWNSYHIDIEDLRKENVYSVDKVYLNKQLFYTNPHELTFGYLYDGHWKIYRPNETKKNKWLPNNVPITAMDGLDNIKNCDIAFINKSKKDYIVIKKLFECSCAVQNEGLACFSEENVNYLKSNSKRQILSFDSDVTGVKNSQQITQLFGFDYCNVPKQYLSEGIKDWADLGKTYGMKAIEKYLIEKNLI